MAPSARLIERSTLAAGALALAASSFLPTLAHVHSDAWTLYSVGPVRRVSGVAGTNLWNLRPSLALLLLGAAALVVAVGFPARSVAPRLPSALAVLATVALVVLDARNQFGVVVVIDHDVARLSWWLAVPVLGGLASAAALVFGRGAQRGT